MIFRNLLAGATALAFAVWLFSRGWRRLPLFGAYLLIQMPLLIGFRPENDAWLASWWVRLEPAIVLLRVAAVWEAFRQHTEADAALRDHRRRLALSLLMLTVMLLAIVWSFVPGNALQNISQARRLIQIGLAAFLGLHVTLMWAVGRLGAGWRVRHVLGLLAMLVVYAVISVASLGVRPWSREAWHLMDDAANVVMSGILVAWAIVWWIGRSEPTSLPAPQAARRDG